MNDTNQTPNGTVSPLVVADAGGVLTTTSLVIAEGTQAQHRAVLQLIRQNTEDFEDFGRVAFEMQPFETAGGTQSREVAVLNEAQATLLLTFMRNTPIVKAFKKNLVHAFFAMRDQLPLQSPELDMARGIIAAKQMLDAATAQRDALAQHAVDTYPQVQAALTHAAAEGDKTRQDFARDIQQWAIPNGYDVKQQQVFAFLSTRKLSLFIRGERSDAGHATADAIKSGRARNREKTVNGHNRVTGVLTPVGQAYAWDRIVRHLSANGTLDLPRQIGGVA